MGTIKKYNDDTLPDLATKYLKTMGTKSIKTHERYRQGLHRLCAHLDELGCALDSIAEEELIEVVDMIGNEGSGPDAISSFLNTLQPFFNWMLLQRGVDKDEISRVVAYCKKMHRKSKKENAYPALTLAQQGELISTLKNPFKRMIVWASMSYGLRAQELCRLTVDDIKINESGLNDAGEKDWGYIFIRETKGNKSRRIYLLPDHIPIWKYILSLRKLNEITFPQVFFWNNAPLDERRYSGFFRRHIANMVPFKMTSHSLRRTSATNWYRKGVDIVVIQNLLGHEDITTTRIYINVLEQETQRRYLDTMLGTE